MNIGLNNLKATAGSRHRRKIIGRGEGSGHGGSATRGMKGQKSRSGGGKMPGFEGGQMPIFRRIPKRGFNNKHRVEFEVVNVETLDRLFESGNEVTIAKVRELGLAKKNLPLKILGSGDIKKALTVKANAFSESAMEKIKKAGGTAETVK